MSLCQSSKTSLFLFKIHHFRYQHHRCHLCRSLFLGRPVSVLPNSVKFRCIFDQILPKFSVTSSLGSVFASGNAIGFAAAAGSRSMNAAVASAITQVAVTAVPIASGAYLSTKVDFLWPKVEEQSEENFGDDVAKLVAGVSRLSYINQLLRRHLRINVNRGTLGHEEANNIRVMLLGMVDDPRVVLIKLADRLHNMRTIYVLGMEVTLSSRLKCLYSIYCKMLASTRSMMLGL